MNPSKPSVSSTAAEIEKEAGTKITLMITETFNSGMITKRKGQIRRHRYRLRI